MTESVRVVADGEELVLSASETFRVGPPPAAVAAPAARRLAIQYMGFRDADGHREYALKAQRGDEERRYILSIALAAFAERRALLQNGPDICYQKLARMLESTDPLGTDTIAITDGELAIYRDAHAPPVRRGFSASLAPVARTPEPAGDGS